jgi:hypothetical protein
LRERSGRPRGPFPQPPKGLPPTDSKLFREVDDPPNAAVADVVDGPPKAAAADLVDGPPKAAVADVVDGPPKAGSANQGVEASSRVAPLRAALGFRALVLVLAW